MPVTEDELKKAAIGPRVTEGDVEASIASEHYFTASQGVTGENLSRLDLPVSPAPKALGLLTFCVLVLENGFTVTGQSACADPANYNPQIGNRIARANAVSQIWPLLGYELRSQLHETELESKLTWLERAEDEHADLIERLTKLTVFMQSPAFREVQVQDQIDLRCQATAMNSYACDLGRRITRNTYGRV